MHYWLCTLLYSTLQQCTLQYLIKEKWGWLMGLTLFWYLDIQVILHVWSTFMTVYCVVSVGLNVNLVFVSWEMHTVGSRIIGTLNKNFEKMLHKINMVLRGAGTVRKEWGPKWKRDLFIRQPRTLNTTSRNKDDQDRAGNQEVSHDTHMKGSKQDMKLRRHKRHNDELRHFWWATTLLVCYDTGMLRHTHITTTATPSTRRHQKPTIQSKDGYDNKGTTTVTEMTKRRDATIDEMGRGTQKRWTSRVRFYTPGEITIYLGLGTWGGANN